MTVVVPRTPVPRVLVLSMFLAPCREVGGKRFTYLSRYLSGWCEEYHVLARCENTVLPDAEAFTGNVHRVRMRPHYPPRRIHGIVHAKLVQLWFQCLCLIDPYVGWIVPAIHKGLELCRRHRLNLVIVTVPSFASLVAAALIARLCGIRLVIDYRDPWTNCKREFPVPFGRRLSVLAERVAIKHASAAVFCTQPMREEFVRVFGAIAPPRLEVIYNGFENFELSIQRVSPGRFTSMIYAGSLYGARRLDSIASVLSDMVRAGEIDANRFRFVVYTDVAESDLDVVERLGLCGIIKFHAPVPYGRIKEIMRECDVLFLPSGDDFSYAVPYKFFDYLSVRRPILAVAPLESGVHQLMSVVDCGEFAEFGNHEQIRQKLRVLLRRERAYTFEGADRFRWENAARHYLSVIEGVLEAGRPIR